MLEIATNTWVGTIGLGYAVDPLGVAVTPDGAFAYVATCGYLGCTGYNAVEVIATATNTVVATIPLDPGVSYGLAITPDGAFAYVPNYSSNIVSVIATATNTVVGTIPVGDNPFWVAFTPTNSPPSPNLCGNTLKTACSYEFSLEQGTQKTESIQLINPGSVSRSAALEIVNPYSGLSVSLAQPNPITIAPGETKTLSLILDPGTTPVSVYDDLLLKVTADDGSTLYSSIKVYVGAGQLPDLAISAKDIRVTTNADGTVTLAADIHNHGTAPASNVQVQFYEFGNSLSTPVVAQVPPNGIGSASITVPAMTAGDHLIRVVIDPTGAIQELDKTNNESSQIVRIGSQSPTEGNILVTGSLPSTVYAGSLFTLTGQAVYAITINGTTNTDYVVKGGAVQITVEGNGAYGDIHTDVNGNFSKALQAPAAPGTYHISMTVTDQTFIGTRELVFNVIEAHAPGSPPPAPPSPPTSSGIGNWTYDAPAGTWTWVWTTPPTESIPQSDLRVFSEDIHFSKDNPAANEEITLFAEIKYWASSTTRVAHNVPVNLYATPVTDPATPRMKIGQTVINSFSVGSPDFGSRYVYATWKNPGQGIYLVEVEIDPSYVETYVLNNAATRAIIVGQMPSGLGVISGQVTTPLGGMGSVMIHVLNASGTEIGNKLTDQTGAYLVKDVPLGTLQVHIDTPTGYLVMAPDTETMTATLSSNEPVGTVNFHLAKPADPTPPVITPTISGTLGSNGWYISNVTVSWAVVDNESAITAKNGCDTTTVTTDTAGVTFTCSATSSGGTASKSVTIQRDATPPAVSVTGVTNGASYTLGSVPTAGCTTTDTLSGVQTSATVSVAGGDANGLGTFTASCTGATDKAGNPGTTASVTYKVSEATGPGNPVLDNFNRPNGRVGPNWSGATGISQYAIENGQVEPDGTLPIYWNGTNFGRNQEAFVTLKTIDPDGVENDLLLKVQTGSAGAINYKRLSITHSLIKRTAASI